MALHPRLLPFANDNQRPLPARDRDSRARLLVNSQLCGGGWLVEDAPRAPVLNMTLAAAGERLVASWR